MAGGKSVWAAAITIDNVREGRQRVKRIGGAHTFHHGANLCGANLVGEHNGCYERQQIDASLLSVASTEEYQQRHRVHRYPDKAPGKQLHKTVEESGVAPVEGQKNFGVERVEKVYHRNIFN